MSGGPLGSEGVIAGVGPLIGLGSLLVFALVFSIPQAMITAELSTAFPSNGGYSIWVQAAFGDFWGVQESYWSWFSGVVDSAIYPVLLYSTAAKLLAGTAADPPADADVPPTCAANATLAAGGGFGGADGVGGVGGVGNGTHGGPDGSRTLWLCMFEPGSGQHLLAKLLLLVVAVVVEPIEVVEEVLVV